jgi:hypothetical protein
MACLSPRNDEDVLKVRLLHSHVLDPLSPSAAPESALARIGEHTARGRGIVGSAGLNGRGIDCSEEMACPRVEGSRTPQVPLV